MAKVSANVRDNAPAPEARPVTDYGPQRWLTVPVAARYCSLNAKAIRTAIKKGEIPRRKIGKSLVVDARALDEWLEGDKVRQ